MKLGTLVVTTVSVPLASGAAFSRAKPSTNIPRIEKRGTAGRSMNIYFASATDETQSVGLGTAEEVHYVDGRWVPGRRLNGDETPEWKTLRFPANGYSIRRVKLYSYR